MDAPAAPDVSVITPVWNAAEWVSHAIHSVQAQEGVTWEMLIVDDASSDDTGEVVQKIAREDPRIRYVALAENGGPSRARNAALDLAAGRFVAVLDDDDQMAPERLQRLIAVADATGADLVVDNMMRVADHPGGDVLGSFLSFGDDFEGGSMEIDLRTYLDPASEQRFGAGLGFLKPLFRREMLDELGLRYDETLRNTEDYFLVAHALANGARMLLLRDAGYFYTQRQGSLSYRLSGDRAQAICDAFSAFYARYTDHFDAATAKAAAAQAQTRANALAFARLVDSLKAVRPDKVAGTLAKYPSSVPHMARELMRIAREKLSA
ncbi:MAG: glycosyltransferase family 2 protein [Pseudomonadota bacterium]